MIKMYRVFLILHQTFWGSGLYYKNILGVFLYFIKTKIGVTKIEHKIVNKRKCKTENKQK